MTKDIILEINGVYINDFDTNILAASQIQSVDGGVLVHFSEIEGLIQYKNSLLLEDDTLEGSEQRKEFRGKINSVLNKALRAHYGALDAIKSYAETIFYFVLEGEGHREDKKLIYNTMLADIELSANGWELDKAVRDATFELGILSGVQQLAFDKIAQDEVNYYFDKMKAQLIVELKVLLTGLVD